MTTVVKNINISDLLKVSGGDMVVMEKTTEEFRELVQAPFKKAKAESIRLNTAQSGQVPTGKL